MLPAGRGVTARGRRPDVRAWPLGPAAIPAPGASGSGSGRRWGSGRSAIPRWRKPTGADGAEDLVRRVEVELDESLAPEFELESVDGHSLDVAIAPDLVPPAGVLGGDIGRLVVEASQKCLGLADPNSNPVSVPPTS